VEFISVEGIKQILSNPFFAWKQMFVLIVVRTEQFSKFDHSNFFCSALSDYQYVMGALENENHWV
jgi:hypothetical protein